MKPSLPGNHASPSPTRSGDQAPEIGRVRVAGLKVDYVDRPFGLQNTSPHFSWRLESAARSVRQTAYRLRVASAPAVLAAGTADVWDSGKIAASSTLSIPYRGQPLHSRQRCYWTVQVWDELGQPTEPAQPSWWEMGLLSPEDWTAQWIAADDATTKADRETPLHWMWGAACTGEVTGTRRFRIAFDLPEPTSSGVLFAVGRSCCETIARVWLDEIQIASAAPGCHVTGEPLRFEGLPAGRHLLVVEVRREIPWPESFARLPDPGIALHCRFETGAGRSFRVVSGAEWQTSTDDTWVAVCSSRVERNVLRDAGMHLRREFSVEQRVASARLYVTALGCYEARLNGHRVGDALLTPEISQYEQRLLYQVYDVSALIARGSNVLGCTVGDGWYASHPGQYAWGAPPRRLLAQLELTYVDGTRGVVATGPDWRLARSPILQSELCVGEMYDARLEHRGWDTADFDDSAWLPASPAVMPQCRLDAQVTPPIRATQILKPTVVTCPRAGVHVFDFGQNFAGWCRLHVQGVRGARIDLRYAERLQPDGEVDQFSLNGGKAVDTYFLGGARGTETFEPRFAYHGFRYVQVTGLPSEPTCDSLEGIVLHTDLPSTGRLHVAHPLIEKLWQNIVWTQRSNFMSVGTDCCNRDERMGYFNDMSIFWDAASFNMDVAAFTRRQMENARDHQYHTGAFAPLAPAPAEYIIYRSAEGTATPGWGDGVLILAWTSWRRYGDVGVLEQNWHAMNRHLQYIEDRNPEGLWLHGRGPDFGDWLAIDEQHFMRPEIPPTTPHDMFATAYWSRSADLLAQMADALSKVEDAKRLRALRERVRAAFIEAFVSADGRVGNGSQTSQLLALQFDLVPVQMRGRVVQHLVNDIRARGGALSTGIIGTQYLLDALADGGEAELACSLLLRREYPSWGYMIDQDATTVWERWDGSLDRKSLTASHNHFAFGSVGSFLFRRLGGIEEAESGFRKIRVRPLFDARLPDGGADYDSIMGPISVRWRRRDERLMLDVTIPANCTATIHVPVRNSSVIREGGEAIASCSDIRASSYGGETLIEIGSGAYRFTVEPASSSYAEHGTSELQRDAS